MARRLLILAAVILAAVLGGTGLIRFAGTSATEFSVNGSELRMSGVITGAATERFERLIAQNPGLETLVLGDMPGTDDLSWLIAIGIMAEAAGLGTRAEGVVVNDAALLWLAGSARSVEGGTLVFSNVETAAAEGWPFDTRQVAAAERRTAFVNVVGDGHPLLAEIDAARASGQVMALNAEDLAGLGLLTAQ